MKYLTILMLFISTSIYSQDVKDINFIIEIDEEIVISAKVDLFITSKDGICKEINFVSGFCPGKLLLKDLDYKELLSDSTQRITLEITYYDFNFKKVNEMEIYFYEIEAEKFWFDVNNLSFFILKIYNLDKRKYRKRFDPLSKDQNYTFEYSTSSGNMLRFKTGTYQK